MVHKNRRTLKKRIRKIVSLCILITILLFGSIVTFLTAQVSKSQAVFIVAYYSNFIGDTMNSEYFLKQMDIKGLEEFDPTASKAQEWIENLRKSEESENLNNIKPPRDGNLNVKLDRRNQNDINIGLHSDKNRNTLFFQPEKLAQISITLNNQQIYKSRNWDTESPLLDAFSTSRWKDLNFVPSLLNFFNTESEYLLSGSKGDVIGNIRVRVDSGYILILFLIMAAIIIFAALLCLVISNIISKFFTISIAGPLNQLEAKISAIASGDYKSTLNAQIILKKPLREIESLAYSTNMIMYKMRQYNDLLESQKEILKNQNEELEAQNDDLIESKRKIEETQALLVQSENMASIGQLTAAITHEINTPLGAINSNTQLSTMMLDMLGNNDTINSNDELSSIITQMKESNDISVMACERVAQIIRSLKNFTKLDQAEFQEADINEGIKSVLILTSNLWKRKITIHEDYGALPNIKCFSGLLNQVFMNLIVNAIQAIHDNGDLYIKTCLDDKNVYISIRDSGCGIKEEHLSRIFDMGFSTKAAGIGAGLGLSICSNIIRKHNGEIKVSSEVGEGTEFIVSIPLNIESVTQSEAKTTEITYQAS